MTSAVGYMRVSTRSQVESGLSLEAQRDWIEGWCDSQKLTLEGIFEDAGLSGSTPVAERAGLMAALAWAKETGAKHLVVHKLDRLSRSPFILLFLEKEAERAGIRITSVSGEGTEDDEPTSVLVRRLLQAVAEHELAMISARTKTALARKKAKGERLGRPPYGFSVDGGKLLPDERFPRLIEVHRLYAGGDLSMRKVTKVMVEKHPLEGWNLKRTHSILNRWTIDELEGSKWQ